jgi:uncharacterized SAM-binding protein YcdF (DUF218 family)
MNILLILLGSNISYLLNDRVHTAIHFVGKYNDTNIDWFLSGGIKNPNEDTISEAEKMSQTISKYQHKYTTSLQNNKWSYIHDTESTNTAENFIRAKQFINESNKKYNELYIVTSEFHHNRAKKISEKLLTNIEPKWILGNAELHDSYYWEGIHIQNVNSDVEKALKKV